MALSTIPLPRLRIASQPENLELTLQGYISLELPEELNELASAGELLDAVKEKHLWIARTGSCHLNISIYIHDGLVSADIDLATLAVWIQDCELWHRLGLRLQYSADQDTHLAGQMSFSIQHPDLSSALVAPVDASTARFRAVSCSVNISTPPKVLAPLKPVTKPRKRARKTVAVEKVPDDRAVAEDDELFQCLTAADRQAIDDFVARVKCEADGGNTVRGQQGRTKTVQEILGSDNMRNVLHALLGMLVFEPGRTYKGVKVLESTPSQTLTELMPAVFHIPYLKVISDRARLLPVIASSLARMGNAESAILRRKVTSLKGRVTPVNNSNIPDDANENVRAIEKGAWETLLASTKTPSLRKTNGGHTARSHQILEAEETPPQVFSSSPRQFSSLAMEGSESVMEYQNASPWSEQSSSTMFDSPRVSNVDQLIEPHQQRSKFSSYDAQIQSYTNAFGVPSVSSFDSPSVSVGYDSLIRSYVEAYGSPSASSTSMQSGSSISQWYDSSPMSDVRYDQADGVQLHDPGACESFDQFLRCDGNML